MRQVALRVNDALVSSQNANLRRTNFMKKLFKKPLAVFLVLALIVGSITVAVNALTENDHGIFNVYTKFYIVDDDGNTLNEVSYDGTDTNDGTLYVKKGDRIKAVMSFESKVDENYIDQDSGADFNVNAFQLIFSYNNKMLTTENAYTPGNDGKNIQSTIGELHINEGDSWIPLAGGTVDANKTYIAMFNNTYINTSGSEPYENDGLVFDPTGNGKDVVAFYFTVNSDAPLTATSIIEFETATVASMPDKTDLAVYGSHVDSSDSQGGLAPEYFYLTVNGISENLAFGGSINYNTINTTLGVTGTIAAGNGITNKGSGVYEEVGQNGANATLPSVTGLPEGVTFLGWATTQNATAADVTADTLKAENPDTLYAAYKKAATVTFDFNDDDQTADQVVNTSVGAALAANEVPTPAEWPGHEFKGWTKSGDTAGTLYQKDDIVGMTVPDGGLTFTAQWDDIPYTITYEYTYENVKDADRLTAPEQVANKYVGDDIPAKTAETKTGYNVTDWKYYDADENEITNGKMPASNVTAKATQSGIPYTLSYSISGDIPNGVAAPTDDGTYYTGDSKALETVAPVEGYTFSGWMQNGSAVSEVTFVDDNIEVTGVWTKGNYAVTYEYEYENVKDADKLTPPAASSADYGDDIPAGPAATKDGYTVSEWKYYDASGTEITNGKMPAGPVTAKATQSAIPYTLTYEFTGTVAAPAGVTAPTDNGTYYIGDTKTLETVTAPNGYTFSGWKLNGSDVTSVTFGAENITVTGEWTKGNYSITYEYEYENVKDADKLTPPAAGSADFGDPFPVIDKGEKEGYEVSDWKYYDANGDEITDGKMPAGPVTAKATQSAIPYTLTYEFTGTVVPAGVTAPTDNGTYYIGDSKTLETVTEPEGYEFSGWKKDGTDVTSVTFGADNITVTGEWTAKEYKLNFDFANESTNPDEQTVAYNTPLSEVNVPDNPEWPGHTFSGWKDGDGNVYADKAAVEALTMPAKNLTLTAQWEVTEVTFKHADGSTETITGAPGTAIPQDNIPDITDADEKDGYDAEWDNVPTSFPAVGATVPEVTIKYTPKPVEITFLDEDGNPTGDPVSILYDEAIPSDKIPGTDKPGKNFAGWVIEGTNTPFDPTKPIEGQLPDGWVEAFSLTPVYNVSDSYYVADGVDKDGNITYASTPAKQFAGDPGDEYEVPGEDVAVSDKYKDQLVFKGWSLTEGGDVITPEGKLGEENAKYYAIYEVKEYNVKYLVDGKEVANEDVAFGGNLADTQPADPSKEGYKFAGWKDKDGKKPDDYGTMPAKDLVFEAQWASEDVSATFMKQKLNGDYITFDTIPQTVGQPIITPETSAYNPFKFGYKFTGWQDENGKAPEDYDGMPSEDVTFYAQYELDETFIALAIGGAVVSGVVVGSVFAGNAALITAGAIVGGVVLIGGAIALAKHTYKVTYYVDGDVYKTYYILEGTKVLVPSDPVREGREFTGWDKPIPEKMPANDLEFNATFDKAGNGSKGTNGNTNGYADTDSEIPATGSAAAGISAFAVIASAAAAAYVLSVRKKKEY